MTPPNSHTTDVALIRQALESLREHMDDGFRSMHKRMDRYEELEERIRLVEIAEAECAVTRSDTARLRDELASRTKQVAAGAVAIIVAGLAWVAKQSLGG